MPATYEPIATTTLSSAATNITFSSIPATYTDLRVVFVGTCTSTGSLLCTFNNDTSPLYSQTILAGGAAASSSRTIDASQVSLNNNVNLGTVPQARYIDVFSYAGSRNKSYLAQTIADLNGSGFVEVYVGIYRSTSAINRLDVFSGNNTLAAGSTATLYGIKNA
jgi:hypothetical protein